MAETLDLKVLAVLKSGNVKQIITQTPRDDSIVLDTRAKISPYLGVGSSLQAQVNGGVVTQLYSGNKLLYKL